MGDSIIKVQQIVCQEKNAILEIIYADLRMRMNQYLAIGCSSCVRQSAYDDCEGLGV